MLQKEPSWPLHCVVFDLDGLLIDTEPLFAEAARRLLARREKEFVASVIQGMMGMPAAQALKLFRDHYQLADSIEELSEESSQLFYEALGEEPARLMSGALRLLGRLEENKIPKAIATSSSRRYVDYILRPHGLLERFDFVLTCDDVRDGKPAPEIYEKAASRFGHSPANMLVLEDSPNGLRAAKAAGARCVIVPHATVPTDQLEGADAILASLSDDRLYRLLGI